jgi:hypothetical protein
MVVGSVGSDRDDMQRFVAVIAVLASCEAGELTEWLGRLSARMAFGVDKPAVSRLELLMKCRARRMGDAVVAAPGRRG